MSVRSHSKWNRTFTWMLSAALIAQGGIAVYAGDFGSEASVEAISEEAAQQVGTEEDFGSDLEFSGDEETTAGEENTETGTDAAGGAGDSGYDGCDPKSGRILQSSGRPAF